MAIRYYFKGTSNPAVWGMVRKMARRIRNRVYIRLYRMPEDELREHIGTSCGGAGKVKDNLNTGSGR